MRRTSNINVDLPPRETKRWVVRRKAAVVSAVRSGAIGLEEVCRRYELSEEEFRAWEQGIAAYGVAGLRSLGYKSIAMRLCSDTQSRVTEHSARSRQRGFPRRSGGHYARRQ